jgi:hypothetical protein
MKKFFKVTILIILATAVVLGVGVFALMPKTPKIDIGDDWYRETTTFVTRTYLSDLMGRPDGDGSYRSSNGHYRISAVDGGLYQDDKNGTTLMLNNVRELCYTPGANVYTDFAITTDNILYAWGANYNGVLGDGTGKHSDKPIAIMENVLQLEISQSANAV